ncbi:TRAP transporter small permease [bacterium AH-315-J19]|nr:TRAP transporter small permease [Robiginitomaculum sp.]MBN4058513.1 TRAP transporter small permease [bacterium AH-315-J19]
MTALTSIVDRVLRTVLIFLMGFLVVVVSWQVISRYILSSPSSYTEEIARFTLIWIGLLGAAHALRMRMHLGIDLLVNKLTGKAKSVVLMFSWLVSLSFAFFAMTVGGFYLVQLTLALEQTSAALGIKMGYVYLAIPFSGLLMCFYIMPPLYSTVKAVFRRPL